MAALAAQRSAAGLLLTPSATAEILPVASPFSAATRSARRRSRGTAGKDFYKETGRLALFREAMMSIAVGHGARSHYLMHTSARLTI